MNFSVVVFDVGRTLMEYKDMPNSWLDYYPKAFEHVNQKLGLNLDSEQLNKSLETFRSFSPSINYREHDCTPEEIFSEVTAGWNKTFKLSDVIDAFFESMNLQAYIYPDAVPVLKKLKDEGFKIAALTDVATGMPDSMHKSYFSELLEYFDMYVSSSSCGFKKPSIKGLQDISEGLNASAADMIMVGDEPKDIEVAKRFGCKSVHIDRNNSGEFYGEDYKISDLYGLLKILER